MKFASHQSILATRARRPLPPGDHGITEGLGRVTCHGWALRSVARPKSIDILGFQILKKTATKS